MRLDLDLPVACPVAEPHATGTILRSKPFGKRGRIPVGKEEASLAARFLDDHDLAPNSRRAIVGDLRKFAAWFAAANKEPFVLERVTVRDVTDFREHLRREKGQAVATVNRCLVSLRRFLAWLAEAGYVPTNPARKAKQLRKQALAPKGLDRAVVRRLLREVARYTRRSDGELAEAAERVTY
jgi:integrase/recombinase XerC